MVTGGLGAFEFETRHRGFDDHSMDVTTYLGWTIDETRFNIADVEALEWIMVNTPGDQEALRRWDINGSQSIDSEDVAWLEQLVGAGYDSGFRCDLDGDRLPDCGNRELIAQMFGHVLGEPEYRVELDLGEWEPPPHDPNYPVPPNGPDGDNDVADLARFMTCLCPWALGDMNCDGVVGFGDINPFVLALSGQQQYELAFPNCRWLNGDMNCDGTVSLADQNLFIACVVAGGGCHCPE